MAANANDWQISPLPERRMHLELGRAFDRSDMTRIRNGLVPEQMEDKWFIYFREGALHLHRSWTGYCIYVVRFVEIGEGACRMTEVAVNCEPEQYRPDAPDREVRNINDLIDCLLLERYPEPPRARGSNSQAAACR